MSKPEGENRSLSPEELQATTIEAYNRIPKYTLVGKGEPLPQRMFEMFKHVSHRFDSELRPILVKKFDELISNSPTTSHYKELMHLLTDHVCVRGRGSNSVDDSDEALFNSLQINGNGTGIYTLEGACNGERILFDWAVDELLMHIRIALLDGEEPMHPAADFTILGFSEEGFKDFLLEWHKEFTEHYQRPMDSNMEELSD